METAGLTPEDLGDNLVEVWPENEGAYNLFVYMRTQWRSGGMGPTGLDYVVMHHKMDRMNLAPEQYEELEADLQFLEMSALAVIYDRDE